MGGIELPQLGEGRFQRSPHPPERSSLLLDDFIVENVLGRAMKAKIAGHVLYIALRGSHTQHLLPRGLRLDLTDDASPPQRRAKIGTDAMGPFAPAWRAGSSKLICRRAVTQDSCQPALRKIFRFIRSQNQRHHARCPTSMRGGVSRSS